MTRIALSDSESAIDQGNSAPREADMPQLGKPLGIHEAAALLGCSPWTVRQRLIPAGLPYIRFSSTSKFVFYEGQLLDWITRRQQRNSRRPR